MPQILYNKLYILIIISFVLAACGNSTSASSSTSIPSAATEESALQAETEKGSASSDEMENPVTEAEITSSSNNAAIVVLTAAPVSSLDPYLMSVTHPDGSVAAHIWDTLIWLNSDLKLEPGLAESWQLVNNLVWEIKLRQGVNFHNGEPVNAEAVTFSVERAQTLPNSIERFSTDVQLERIEVVDEYTIRFHTQEPTANFPYYLSSLEILPPLYYGEANATEIAEMPVGSGPYQFVEKTPEGGLTLKAVPDYWRGSPAIKMITFQPVPDASQRAAELASGRADLITDLEPAQAITWDSAAGQLKTVESTRRIFVGVQIETGTPLADKRVRQALNYAVDVQAIVDEMLDGYGQRYGNWVNSSNANISPWPFDPDKARQLLAEAGYNQGLDLVLDTPIGRYYQDEAVAQAIAEQLGQVGINVEIRAHDWPAYVDNYLLPRQTAPLFLLGLNSRGNVLEDTANLSFSFPFNLTGWQNAEFEQLLQEARKTFNEQQREALLNRAQEIAYEEAPWIWLWRQYNFYGVTPDLDWQPRADGLIYLFDNDKVVE